MCCVYDHLLECPRNETGIYKRKYVANEQTGDGSCHLCGTSYFTGEPMSAKGLGSILMFWLWRI